MRSSEIAELADVTVRTLRHYHALGLLPEPDRRDNGYRDYGVEDLVTLLRIKRLASLGFSLEQIKALGKQASEGQPDELASLDEELAARIAQLEAQRAMVVKLRAQGVCGHVPPDYADFIGALAAHTRNADLMALEADTVLLADSLLPRDVANVVRAYHRAILDRGQIATYAALNERYINLGPTTSLADQDSLVTDYAAFLVPLLDEVLPSATCNDLSCGTDTLGVLLAFDEVTLNAVQRNVAQRIEHATGEALIAAGVITVESANDLTPLLDPDVTS